MALMMQEAVPVSETSVYCNQSARRYIPECCSLHNSHHENLNSHLYCRVYKRSVPTGLYTEHTKFSLHDPIFLQN